MRKVVVLTVFLFSISIVVNAEYRSSSDTTPELKKKLPYYIETLKDLMTDKEYAFGSKSLLCSEDGKKGFIIRVSWNNKKGEVSYSGLNITSAGIGSCTEKDNLIILFEDDTKFSIDSWQDFNCKGNSYFDLKGNRFDEFNSKKVKAIRFQNGRTFESYTYKLAASEQTFFIEAKAAIDQKRIVITKDAL